LAQPLLFDEIKPIRPRSLVRGKTKGYKRKEYQTMNPRKSSIAIIAVVLTVGVATLGFAWGGYGPGYGGHMMGYGGGYGYMGPGMMGWGPGYGHMWGDYGPNGYANLSPDDAAKLQQSQDQFFDQTRDLRNSIRDKQLALNDELQKSNPDKAKVADLQKQLSQLESQFDQKALDHQLELRKEFPQGNLAYGGGYGRGGYCGW
jgi:Spy/CpxP family protein refolding chaperone